jgi:EAL domain-containing protein (putative c-di-GMP-specific phosphodiesterase class I)
MVLESCAIQRSCTANRLRQTGNVEVVESAHGRQALDVLTRTGGVDIVLCDLQMEGMDVLAFLRQAAQGRLLHSLIIQGSHSPELLRSIRQLVSLLGLRLLGYTYKPFSTHQLQGLMRMYHHSHALAREAQTIVPLANETDVRAALAAGQFHAYYQPKFNLKTFEICGVEVLARWQHPQQGLLSPAVFMPTLERCELLDDLLLMQMQQALALQHQMRTTGVTLSLAFNLHASQLARSALSLQVKALLTHYQASPSSVTFELTESGMLDVSANSLECLLRLRMMGCNLSIDDFGAGFSSLQRLCDLPFNEIKLDAQFAYAVTQDLRSRVVISTIQKLGTSLGMAVVIEGIETQEQCRLLQSLGCLIGQGYVFSRAISESHLIRWFDEKVSN